jgi:TctA family transporter
LAALPQSPTTVQWGAVVGVVPGIGVATALDAVDTALLLPPGYEVVAPRADRAGC